MPNRPVFTDAELSNMQENHSESADIIGRRVPYHLQYLRDGKPNVRPEVHDGEFIAVHDVVSRVNK